MEFLLGFGWKQSLKFVQWVKKRERKPIQAQWGLITALFLMWGALFYPPALPPLLLLPFQPPSPHPCYLQSWKWSSSYSGTLWSSLRQMERLIDRGLLRSQRAPERRSPSSTSKCRLFKARSCCFMIKVTSSVSSFVRIIPKGLQLQHLLGLLTHLADRDNRGSQIWRNWLPRVS